MNKKDVSITMKEASSKSIIMIMPIVAFQYFLYLFINRSLQIPDTTSSLVFIGISLAGFIIHELIHLFAWAVFARKPLSAFKLGFQWKSLAPYAHCTETMDITAYRIGSFSPGLLLGIIPWLVSLFTGNELILLFGLLYTAAAGGDFLILWLLRNVKPNTLVEDHPSNAGCYIFEE